MVYREQKKRIPKSPHNNHQSVWLMWNIYNLTITCTILDCCCMLLLVLPLLVIHVWNLNETTKINWLTWKIKWDQKCILLCLQLGFNSNCLPIFFHFLFVYFQFLRLKWTIFHIHIYIYIHIFLTSTRIQALTFILIFF